MIQKNKYIFNLNIFVCMFLILFTAKAFGFLTISWWWVVLPLAIPMILVTSAIALFLVVFFISMIVDR